MEHGDRTEAAVRAKARAMAITNGELVRDQEYGMSLMTWIFGDLVKIIRKMLADMYRGLLVIWNAITLR